MSQLVVTAQRAEEVPEKCEHNARLHEGVLRSQGLADITSAQRGWWRDPETCVLLLEDGASGEPLGGIRLQRWGGALALPIELALAPVDAGVHDWVAGFVDDGVAELCGLWCAPRLRGLRLGSVLVRMGLSLASVLGTRTVLGLCDTRHVAQNRAFGFARDTRVARQGAFEYPRPGLFAHVLRIADAVELPTATASNRALVQGYRAAPLGTEVFTGPNGCLELSRDLRLPVPRGQRDSRAVALAGASAGEDGGSLASG